MRSTLKKSLALILCLVMCLSLFPATAYADSAPGVLEEVADPVILSVSEESQEEPADSVILRSESDEESLVPAEAEDEILRSAQDDAEESIEAEAALEAVADEAAGDVVASGTCGSNLTWELDDEGTLIISGTGAMWYWYYSSSAPWYSQRSSIKRVELGSGVTSIGNYAFYYCSSLTSVTIPEGVRSIGYYAFSGCSSLTTVTLPEGVTSIGYYAFSGCNGLITAGPIGGGYNYEFGWSSTIPAYAFSGCSCLTSVTIPEGVTSIGDNAFCNCGSLTSITIPEGVTSIGSYAFEYCSGLTSVSLPTSLRRINYGTFSGCSSLTNVTIPEGVTSIGSMAFSGCSSLTSVTIPESVTSIDYYVFASCSGLKTAGPIGGGYNIEFGWSEAIPANAFYGCSSLTSVTIPANVVTIGDRAFCDCSVLQNVFYGGTVRQREELTDNGWSVIGNDPLYNASWEYGTATVTRTIYSFAELRALVEDYDGCDTYVYYNGHDIFTIEESIVLPANLFFCADADGSSLLVPAGVSLTVSSKTINAFYVENLVVEGEMTAYRRATVYRTLSGVVNWLRDVIASGGCGSGLVWTLYDTGELAISGTGYMDYYEGQDAPWYQWRGFVKTLRIGPDVWGLQLNGFSRCRNLTEITVDLGNTSYASVGGVLFNQSKDNLIYFPRGKGGGYIVPAGVTRIESNAFSNCTTLTDVTLPVGLRTLGEDAFSGCTALASVTIPAGVETIEFGAFSDCEDLAQVFLPEGLKTIEGNAFYNCSSLTDITLPDSVTYIAYQAFRGCRGMWRIALPAGLAGIGNYAFFNCSSLLSVYYGGPERRRNELTDDGWSVIGNDWLYNASWEYGTATVSRNIGSFAELKAIVDSFDGSDTYVYYNGTNTFTFEESITLPENLFFCADADGSVVRVPAGVTLTVKSPVVNAFYVENLIVEGSMSAYKRALVYRTLRGYVELFAAPIWSGVTGEVDWTLYEDGKLVFSGTGSVERGPWQEKSDMITSVVVEEGVTSINAYTFENCSNLTSVSLPEGLTRISSSAFYGCTALPFISIPSTVTDIGDNLFYDCSSLTEIAVPSENEHYSSRNGVLFDKPQTRLICFPAGRSGTYTVPGSVTCIGFNAFLGCSGLTRIVLPNILTSIEDYAFSNCSALTGITIPSSVTNIGYSAFSGCSALTDVNIPEGVTSISNGTFECCNSLTSVTIPEGVTSIGDNAFYNCGSLTSITIPESVTSIGSYAFEYCSGLTSVSLPTSLRRINSGTFSGCGSLADVSIPAGVMRIDSSAFYDCGSLTEIAIPEGVKTIGAYAFYNCGSLTEIILPESLIGFYDYAFSGCYALSEVHYGGSIRQREQLTDNGWSVVGNQPLYRASWTYGTEMLSRDIHDFSELKAIADACDGSEYYVYYNGSEAFVFEESITLPEKLYFCADADGSVVRIPAGVTVTVESATVNAFYVENLVIEGEMLAHRGAVYFRSLSGEIRWLPDAVESGDCGLGLSWTLYDDGELVISGTGEMGDFYHGSQPWFNRRADILRITLEPGVTSIGTHAFHDCSNLTTVSLPESLTCIGAHAFHFCSSLTDVTIPKGVTSLDLCAFCGCSSLTGISLPESLTNIGNYAFYDCETLSNITVPAGVTYIGVDALSECPALTAIPVAPENNVYASLDGVLFNKAMTELICCPQGKSGAYTIPVGVTVIGNNAFLKCTNLTSITIPEGVTSIGDRAFMECTLTDFLLPETLNTIGMAAFGNCLALKTVTIPAGVTSIGSSVFTNCINLAAITVAPENSAYASIDGVLYSKAVTALLCCPGAKSGVFTVPEGVTEIGSTAFYSCRGLTSITIPEGVTSIGNNAFSNCSALTSITIPQSATSIGYYAFSGCGALTDVTYAGTVKQKDALIGRGWEIDGNESLYRAAWHCLVDSGSCGEGLSWALNSDGVLTISGSGAMTEYSASSLPAWCTEEDVNTVVVEEGVTSIGSFAFRGCDELTSITIPLSMARIGSSAFSGCAALSEVNYGGTERQKTKLTGSGWSTDGNDALFDALWHCLEPEDGWDYCGDAVFWKLDKTARTLYIKGTGRIWDMTADSIPWRDDLSRVYYVEIDDGVTGIGKQTFLEAGNLRRVTLPESLTRIGVSAFSGCLKLSTIVLPSGITTIGRSAFADCSSLKEIYFEGEPPMIASDSFSGVTATAHCLCSGDWWDEDRLDYGGTLTWVVDHDWTETAYEFDFVGLTVTASRSCRFHETLTESETVALTKSLTMPTESEGGLYLIESAAFENAAFEQLSLRYELPALGTLSVLRLPGELVELDEESLERTDCEAVILPASCRSVGSRAFKGCAQLRYVFLSAGTSIAADAFEGCGDVLLIYR